MSEELQKLLSFDPLSEAKKLTGKSYKDDLTTELLGFGLAISANRRKTAALANAGDTHMGMEFAAFVSVAAAEGFVELWRTPIAGDYADQAVIMWKAAEGLLLFAESYWGGESTNSARVYFNLGLNAEQSYPHGCSGGWHDGCFIGNFDAREGLRHHVSELRKHGTLLDRWIKRPWLWLLTYQDSKPQNYDHAAINAERISKLPADVQLAITP